MLYIINMLHTKLVTIKRSNATLPELEPVAIDHPTLKKSCKKRVMDVVDPILTPISQAVFKHESKLKELESSKVDISYFKEMLEMISKALTNQQKEIDKLIARQQSKDEEVSTDTVAHVLPNQMAFLLKFNTQQDFEKAEPCLRSLSDLLERNDVNFELIEL